MTTGTQPARNTSLNTAWPSRAPRRTTQKVASCRNTSRSSGLQTSFTNPLTLIPVDHEVLPRAEGKAILRHPDTKMLSYNR